MSGAAIDFFVGFALRAERAFDDFDEPEDNAFLFLRACLQAGQLRQAWARLRSFSVISEDMGDSLMVMEMG